MPELYEMKHGKEVQKVLDDLLVRLTKDKLAHNLGVTINGNRVTLRWYMDDKLVDISMIIVNVTTPSEVLEHERQREEMKKIVKKYPGIDMELFHVEHGEYPK